MVWEADGLDGIPVKTGTASAAPVGGRLRVIRTASAADPAEFAAAVRAGLTAIAKSLPCRFFYDEEGSRLFERICELSEYYLTRAETEILSSSRQEIVAGMTGPVSLVELGSGSAVKTRLLIEALLAHHGTLRYIPIDISHSMLEASSLALLEDYPELTITAFSGEYHEGLTALHEESWSESGDASVRELESRPSGPARSDSAGRKVAPKDQTPPWSRAPRGSRKGTPPYAVSLRGAPSIGLRGPGIGEPGTRLILWLGSNIGNLSRPEAAAFLRRVQALMSLRDRMLVGIDLRKDPRILLRAYDDSRGLTARFNLNLLARINHELGGRFRLKTFAHRASYDEADGRVEMHLVSSRAQRVRVEDLGLDVSFAAGEGIHTENSYKYSLDEIAGTVAEARLRVERQWFDAAKRFSLNLLAPTEA